MAEFDPRISVLTYTFYSENETVILYVTEGVNILLPYLIYNRLQRV